MITVVGSGPGVGKSTLCRSLALRLAEGGERVDHFAEADILTRPAFRDVAAEFGDGSGVVRPETLLAAARAYVSAARAEGVDVMLTDALLPFIPSLVAWGHDEATIAGVLGALEDAVAPVRVTVVFLRDDPATALRRAVEREGRQWADWYVGKLNSSPGTRGVHDLRTAAEHLAHETELTLRLLSTSRWDLVVVDVTGRRAAEVAEETWKALTEPASRETDEADPEAGAAY
ncbi:hypothetical protein B1H18_17775 [Streptomyces tsukubensis]|uniref:Uncharacterized protein n=2 Tax=Streptomyces tsukubensis TaxID=83656 RepID=A0A1V4A893_9ACTN|nr:hypothetical protein B1H18_17775 [Streptomyces tsukubensis]